MKWTDRVGNARLLLENDVRALLQAEIEKVNEGGRASVRVLKNACERLRLVEQELQALEQTIEASR